jgi:hypothetical protein
MVRNREPQFSYDARFFWRSVWLDSKFAPVLREQPKPAQGLRFALGAAAAAMAPRYFALEPDPEPQIRARRLAIPNLDHLRPENKSRRLRPESYFPSDAADCQDKIAKTRLLRKDC